MSDVRPHNRAFPVTPTFFKTALHFRDWLEKNHASAPELIVGFRKVGTGTANMTWSESVDEALCFGWIDAVRKRIDDESYLIRFTPRKKGSIWSLVNVAKIKKLTEEGRMHPAGVVAYSARKDSKTGVYAFERDQPAELEADDIREFKRRKSAWKFFQSCPPGYQRVITHWVVSAKRAETRTRRLEQLIQACSEQRRMR